MGQVRKGPNRVPVGRSGLAEAMRGLEVLRADMQFVQTHLSALPAAASQEQLACATDSLRQELRAHAEASAREQDISMQPDELASSRESMSQELGLMFEKTKAWSEQARWQTCSLTSRAFGRTLMSLRHGWTHAASRPMSV